jgi:hypothetical protein
MIELVVAMGLLSTFLLLLVQLLGGGVGIFDEGERGQDLQDRIQLAARATTESLGDMVGPARQTFQPGPPDARLLCEWAPLGFRASGDVRPTRVQVVRATVRLSERDERRLLTERLRARLAGELHAMSDEAVGQRLAELLPAEPRTGRGEMLLLSWPSDPDGIHLELRRGLFLPGASVSTERHAPLFDVELGGPDLPVGAVPGLTEVVATGLLHAEFDLWSQDTRDFVGTPGNGGPERVWDSARAGLLLDAKDAEERFSLDLGGDSLRDARDDVFPRWIRVTLVVARSANDAAEAVLSDELTPDATTLTLNRTDLLPTDGAANERFVKIGGEWIAFGEAGPRQLSGLRRGQRKTAARSHRAGATVRAGRTVVLYLQVPHGRDAG